VVEKGEVADFNSGGRPIALEWACPEVRILLGDESKQGMVVVQIAEIMRTQAGAYALRDTYIPPVMRVGASDFLQASLRRVASALATRSKALSATRRQRTEAHVEFDAGDVSKMLLLAAFNREAPYFAHLAATPETHPYEAFRALIRLTGELCTFVADADPTNFPKYNYLQLGDTFEPLVARALAHINTTVAERFVEIPLKRREDGMYLGKIQDSSLLTHEFFLAARGTLSDAEIHQKLPRLSKIASWNAIGGLLNQAVNGARIELEFRPSGALPVRPGVSFFRVQRTPEYWPDIQSTSTIAIYHPLPIEAIELSLYAVDPEKL
jgi:type VI secretion system protein ImpJ